MARAGSEGMLMTIKLNYFGLIKYFNDESLTYSCEFNTCCLQSPSFRLVDCFVCGNTFSRIAKAIAQLHKKSSYVERRQYRDQIQGCIELHGSC